MTLDISGAKLHSKEEHRNWEVDGRGRIEHGHMLMERDLIERDASVEGHRRDNYLYEEILLVKGNKIDNITIRIRCKVEACYFGW